MKRERASGGDFEYATHTSRGQEMALVNRDQRLATIQRVIVPRWPSKQSGASSGDKGD
jgi:hypothetical protein